MFIQYYKKKYYNNNNNNKPYFHIDNFHPFEQKKILTIIYIMLLFLKKNSNYNIHDYYFRCKFYSLLNKQIHISNLNFVTPPLLIYFSHYIHNMNNDIYFDYYTSNKVHDFKYLLINYYYFPYYFHSILLSFSFSFTFFIFVCFVYFDCLFFV